MSAKAILQASIHFEHSEEEADTFIAVRAVAAAMAFELLDSAIEKNTLEKAMVDRSGIRARSLVVFLAIALEQVLNFETRQTGNQHVGLRVGRNKNPASCDTTIDIAFSMDELAEMRKSLIYHLAYFLRFLIDKLFPKTKTTASLHVTQHSVTLDESFWEMFMQDSAALDRKLAPPKGPKPRPQVVVLPHVNGDDGRNNTDQILPPVVIRPPTFDVLQGHAPYTIITGESYDEALDENEDAKSVASFRSTISELTDDEVKSMSAKLDELGLAETTVSPGIIRHREVQHGDVREDPPGPIRRSIGKFTRGVARAIDWFGH